MVQGEDIRRAYSVSVLYALVRLLLDLDKLPVLDGYFCVPPMRLGIVWSFNVHSPVLRRFWPKSRLEQAA